MEAEARTSSEKDTREAAGWLQRGARAVFCFQGFYYHPAALQKKSLPTGSYVGMDFRCANRRRRGNVAK